MPDKEEVLALVARVNALSGPIAGEERRELPRHYLELMALFDRCRSMLAAMRVLIERDFSHEAMILSRPLITDSLALAELAASDEQRRAELLISWELQSLADLRGVMTEAEAQDIGDFSALFAWIDKRVDEINTYARARSLSTRHWSPDADSKAMAATHDRVTEWMDVRIAHHFVHGSTFATSQRYSPADDGGITVGGPSSQTKLWAIAAGCSGAQSVLLASRSLCSILGINEPTELDPLFAELQSLADRIKAASDNADSASE